VVQFIDGINAIYKSMAASTPGVTFLDCGDLFLVNGGRQVNRLYFMDVIHPNPAGACRNEDRTQSAQLFFGGGGLDRSRIGKVVCISCHFLSGVFVVGHLLTCATHRCGVRMAMPTWNVLALGLVLLVHITVQAYAPLAKAPNRIQYLLNLEREMIILNRI
jgi:hypothetical protein